MVYLFGAWRLVRRSFGSIAAVAVTLAVAFASQPGVDPAPAMASATTEQTLRALADSPSWAAVSAQARALLDDEGFRELVASRGAASTELELGASLGASGGAAERARHVLTASLEPLALPDGKWAGLASRLNAVTQTPGWRAVVDRLLTVLDDPSVAASIDSAYAQHGGNSATRVRLIGPFDWVDDALEWVAEAVIFFTAAAVCGVTVVCLVAAAAGAVYLGVKAANLIEKWAAENRRGMKITAVQCDSGGCSVEARATAKNFYVINSYASIHFRVDRNPGSSAVSRNSPPASGTVTTLGHIDGQNIYALFHRMNDYPHETPCEWVYMDVQVNTTWNDQFISRDVLERVPVSCA